MTIKKYSGLVPSGLNLVPFVPSHWRRTALKRLGKYQNGYPFKPEDWGEEGLPIVRIAQLTGESEPNYFAGEIDNRVRLNDGDLLFSWSTTIDSYIWSGGPAWLNQHIFKVTPSDEAEKSFLFYVIKQIAPKLAEFDAHGSTMRHIKKESLGEKLYVPDRLEQQQIAKFLDYETTKIDSLIAEQKKLIGLLKEKRQAVISHAVTKGINPKVKMKDSGVEWLGEVPEHWKVLPLKRFFQLVVDTAPKENDFELLSLYTDIGVRPRKDLEARGNRSTTTDGYFKVSKGDIIVNKLLAWMGAIGISEYDGVTSPAYDILRAKQPLSPHYYDYLFRCGILFTEFKRYSRGIMDMRLRLYFEEFGQFSIPFPSYEEQLKIVGVLNEKLSKFDQLREQAIKAIDLLEERRSALISAAITGQIDVRDYLYEEAA